LKNDHYAHEIKEIMSFNKEDYENLLDFDLYILLVKVDVSTFVSVTTSLVYNNNF